MENTSLRVLKTGLGAFQDPTPSAFSAAPLPIPSASEQVIYLETNTLFLCLFKSNPPCKNLHSSHLLPEAFQDHESRAVFEELLMDTKETDVGPNAWPLS